MLPVTRRSWLRLAGFRLSCRRDTVLARAASRAAASASRRHTAAMAHAAHVMGPVGRVSTEAFNPAAFYPRMELLGPAAGRAGALLQRDAASRRHAPPRVSNRRRRSRDRDRARRVLPGLDLQRPGARPDHSRNRRRSAAHHVPQPGSPSAHDPLPWLASARNGRVDARTSGDARRTLRLRVRCRAVRPAPLSLPRGSAEAAHPQGSLRRVHRRSAVQRVRQPTSS